MILGHNQQGLQRQKTIRIAQANPVLRRRSNKQLAIIFALFGFFNMIMRNIGAEIGVDWYYLQIFFDIILLGFSRFIEEARLELSLLLVASILSNIITAYDYLHYTNYLYDHYPSIMKYLYHGCLGSLFLHLFLLNSRRRKRDIFNGEIYKDRRLR